MRRLAARFSKLLLDRCAIDVLAVTGDRPLPRANRVGEALLPEAQVAEMVEDHRVRRRLCRRFRERSIRLLESTLLEERPSQAIEVRRVARIDLEGTLEEVDGFVEALPAIGKQVA